jgi:hypothetical protein
MIRFTNWYFILLIPFVIYLFLIRKKKSALRFSSVKILENGGMKKTIKHRIGKYVTTAALILLVIALARPQLLTGNIPVHEKGIDIAVVLDVSGSMQSVDFEPSRLAVALETIDKFIRQRPQSVNVPANGLLLTPNPRTATCLPFIFFLYDSNARFKAFPPFSQHTFFSFLLS